MQIERKSPKPYAHKYLFQTRKIALCILQLAMLLYLIPETIYAQETPTKGNNANVISIITALASFVGGFFTAYVGHSQSIGTLRSQWIDSFRQEVSEFYSQIMTLSLLKKTKLKSKSSKFFNEKDLDEFRDKHKENYLQIYRTYGLILQRLNYEKGFFMRFFDNSFRRQELLGQLMDIMEKNLNNSNLHNFEDNDTYLLHMLKRAEDIIRSERSFIERWIPIRQGLLFLITLGIISSLIFWITSESLRKAFGVGN